MDPFDHANTLNDDRMDDKKWVQENSVDVLMIVVGELRKLFEVVPEMAERTDQSLEQLQDMIKSNKSLIDEQNDKINQLNDKINQLMRLIRMFNDKIDKIEEEFLKELVNIGKDLDNMDEDITKSMISSSQNKNSR